MHWSSHFIGIPWLTGGRNVTEGLDCWGLLRYVYQEQFGIILQEHPAPCGDLAIASLLLEQELGGGSWSALDHPQDGDGVALGQNRTFNHVGIFVRDEDARGDFVLHTAMDQPSMCSPVRQLARFGWNNIAFYRHALRFPV